MFTRVGTFIVRRRKAVLIGTAAFFVLAILLGGGVASKLISGGFEDRTPSPARPRGPSRTDSATSSRTCCCWCERSRAMSTRPRSPPPVGH